MQASLAEREKALEKVTADLDKLTDGFKRSLAEMENLRQRHSREMDNTRKFAIQVSCGCGAGS